MSLVPYAATTGVDIGAIDGNHPNFVAALAAGVRFVGRKASEHTLPDQDFDRDWSAMQSAGVVRFAYHFPLLGPGRAAPAAQIDVLKRVVQAAGGLSESDLPCCLDVEFPSGRLPDARQKCVDGVAELVDRMHDAFGHWPMIYSSVRVADGTDLDALAGLLPARLNKCPLFIKTGYRLRARQPVDQVKPQAPRLPGIWTKFGSAGAWIHQFQGDAVGVPGFNATADVDLFLTMYPNEVSQRVAWVWSIVAGATPMPVQNTYDDQMVEVVKRYQARKALAADGIIGLGTFARLAKDNV